MKKLFLSTCMLLSFVMTDAYSNQCPKALDFEIKRLGDDKVESLCKYKGNVILVAVSYTHLTLPTMLPV